MALGCRSCRRAKASSRCTSVAARLVAWSAFSTRRCERESSPEPAPQQVEIAHDGRQQIVEVVRDAAGELADGLQLLRFVKLGQRLLALARPVGDEPLQLFDRAGDDVACLILPAPRIQRGANGAHQAFRVQRPLQQHDIAQLVEGLERARGTNALVPVGEHDEREVGPWRLARKPVRNSR